MACCALHRQETLLPLQPLVCPLLPPSAQGAGERGSRAPTSLNHQPTVYTCESHSSSWVTLPFLWPKSALPSTRNLSLVQTSEDTSLPQP